MNEQKPLTAAMDNVLAHHLGKIALEAGNVNRRFIGDHIDRGLLLHRLLEEAGFGIVQLTPAQKLARPIRGGLSAQA